MVITEEFLNSVKSLAGGYSKSIVIRLGLVYPPKSGWRQRLIGHTIRDDLFIKDSINPGRWMINTNLKNVPDELLTELAKKKRVKRRETRLNREAAEISYFIAAYGTNRIKIGKTSRPIDYRLAALQTSCPHNLIILATTRIKEKKLHKRFGFCRLQHGEWFTWNDAIEKFMLEPEININYQNLLKFQSSLKSLDMNEEVIKNEPANIRQKYSTDDIQILKLAFKNKFKKSCNSLGT